VSFGRRIGARLLAEGIERRADLAALNTLGVELGQGYLLGKPAYVPAEPRRTEAVPPRRTKRVASPKDPVARPARVPSRA
jgi:EAL domain-containing protein (putative c-di-GMP-specific phosphodiesterase class I)